MPFKPKFVHTKISYFTGLMLIHKLPSNSLINGRSLKSRDLPLYHGDSFQWVCRIISRPNFDQKILHSPKLFLFNVDIYFVNTYLSRKFISQKFPSSRKNKIKITRKITFINQQIFLKKTDHICEMYYLQINEL